jgi:uncharacterized protein
MPTDDAPTDQTPSQPSPADPSPESALSSGDGEQAPAEGKPRLSRRAFVRAAGLAIAGLLVPASIAGWYGGVVEPDELEIVRVTVQLAPLPRSFSGTTIAHISDIHLGPHYDGRRLGRVVDTVMGLGPSLIAMTGDFIDRGGNPDAELPTQEKLLAEQISRLSAPLGVFAVMGNHDYGKHGDAVTRALARADATLLRNSSHSITLNGETVWVVGVDDVRRRRNDMPTAVADVHQEGCVILLVHEPDFADEAARDPRLVLQLSGHSHGGQVRFPDLSAPFLPRLGRKYPQGLYQVQSTKLYTTRGLGTVEPHIRINCPPEITLLEMQVG